MSGGIELSAGSIPAAVQSSAPVKAAHLEYLDGFRGVAIMFVVLIHANNAMLQRGVALTPDAFSPVWTAFHILSHNATVYFALISGILYAYRLHDKPHAAFLRSRFEAVIIPYALVSTGLTALMLAMAARRSGEWPRADEALLRIIGNILTGDAWNHLWYIPVVAILYLISPLLLRAVENPRTGRVFAVTMVCLPLVFSRTATDITIAMLVYFSGVYTAGLVIGRDPERILARLSRRIAPLSFVAAGAAVAVWLLDRSGIEFAGPISVRESAIYVLRMSLAVLMLIGLRAGIGSLGPAARRALDRIAAYSFGIYFLHAPLLRPIVGVIAPLVPAGNPAWALVLAVMASFVTALVLTWLVVHVVKIAAGNRSKFLVGS